jgi:hypothetical protein
MRPVESSRGSTAPLGLLCPVRALAHCLPPSHVVAAANGGGASFVKVVHTFDASCPGRSGNSGLVSFTHLCVTLAETDRFAVSESNQKTKELWRRVQIL